MVQDLTQQHPDRFAAITYHVNDDPFATSWGQGRLDDFYGFPSAVPTFMVDGAWNCPANDFSYCVNQQLTQPTDVIMELGGNQVQGATWDLVARVCLETGADRQLRIHTAATLNDYPNPPRYSTNVLMQSAFTTDINLPAGSCEYVTTRVTFDPISMASTSNIVIIAWAQQPSATGPAAVHQAAIMRWPFPAGRRLTAIEIDPLETSLDLGGEVVFTATGKDQLGDDFPLSNPVWSVAGAGSGNGSFDPASGSANTTFTATAAGSRGIVCSEGGITGTATVEIIGDPILASIEIDPASFEADVGDEVILTATGKDQFGDDFPLDAPVWTVTGSGSGSGVFEPANGSATTTFTATTAGSRRIVCRDGDISGATDAVIFDPPRLTTIEIDPSTMEIAIDGQVSFTATGIDQHGETFELTDPVWRISGDGEGSFDPVAGATTTFTAGYPGEAMVSCSQDGVMGTAELAILGDDPALAAIELSPADASLRVGQELVLSATGADQYGKAMELASPVWSVSGDGHGVFEPEEGSSTTTFRATTTGSVTIQCSEEGIDGSTTAEIAPRGLPAPRRIQGRVTP